MGSYYIYLSVKIYKRRACINVKNSDECCFKCYVSTSVMYPLGSKGNPNRYSSYKIVNIHTNITVLRNNVNLKFENLNFP